MNKQQYDSVWEAIEGTREAADNMRHRATVMSALHGYIQRSAMTQKEAAALLGVTQPRVSDLMRGKIDLFSLDTLVNMASVAGLQVEIRVLEAVA